jgi:AcrR family transcriptional regulator
MRAATLRTTGLSAMFGNAEAPVSLEAIARDAGVGIGTLYRHFPCREALVEALRLWMDRYAQFVAAKRGMAESLRAIFDRGAVSQSDTRTVVLVAVDALLTAGAQGGSLRSDVSADDVVTGLLGVVLASGSPEQSQRMLDLLLSALVASR